MQTTHGMNLVTIGQRIGINPRTVGKWAQGKHKPNKKSRKIENYASQNNLTKSEVIRKAVEQLPE